jgi:hypothetical protein
MVVDIGCYPRNQRPELYWREPVLGPRGAWRSTMTVGVPGGEKLLLLSVLGRRPFDGSSEVGEMPLEFLRAQGLLDQVVHLALMIKD